MGGRRADRQGAAISMAWVASVVGTVGAGVFVLAFRPLGYTGRDFVWTLAATVFVTAVRPLLYYGMERGPMVVFAPIMSVVALVVPAVVGPLTGSGLNGFEVAGVLLALPAVALIAAEGGLANLSLAQAGGALRLGIVTGVLLGCVGLCLSQVHPDAGAMPAFVSQLGAALLLPFVTRPWLPMAPLTGTIRRFGTLVGFIDIGAVIASVIAFQRGNVTVISAILGFAPAVTICLAWSVYNEAIRRWQYLGAALATGAVVLFAAA